MDGGCSALHTLRRLDLPVLLAMALPGALDPSLTSTSSMAGRGLIAIFLFGVVWTIGTTW